MRCEKCEKQYIVWPNELDPGLCLDCEREAGMSSEQLAVWGFWHTENNAWVWGIRPGAPIWSFSRDELERELHPPNSFIMEIREMSDIDIAKIPKAAAAFIAWLHIQEARERLNAAKVQKMSYWQRGQA